MGMGEYPPTGGWEKLIPSSGNRCGCGDSLCQAIVYQSEPKCATLERIRKEMEALRNDKDSGKKRGKRMKWRDFLRGFVSLSEGLSFFGEGITLSSTRKPWSYEEEFGTNAERFASDVKAVGDDFRTVISGKKDMKWIVIAGGWRKTNARVEKDVRKTVRDIIERGDGIVSGGALGVDYIVTDEAMKLNSPADRIKIFLPATLERYAAHYRKRAKEGVITFDQAEMLIDQLSRLKQTNPGAIIEHPDNTVIDKEAYFSRITKIVEAADELVAFHINNTKGTQDIIMKAKKRGIPITLFTYIIA